MGGAHQLAALQDGLPKGLAPEEFEAFVEGLDGEAARAVSLAAACDVACAAGLDADVRGAWSSVLTGIFAGAPYSYGLDYVTSYASCSAVVSPEELFAEDWSALETGLASAASPTRGSSTCPSSGRRAPEARAPHVGQGRADGETRCARVLAIRHPLTYLDGLDPAASVFRAFFAGVLGATDVSDVLAADLRAVVASAAPAAAGQPGARWTASLGCSARPRPARPTPPPSARPSR